ncbi:ATP-dependent helicase HrpB [Glaciecola siphonariae]|uniref:ATP-dependent helicase HrpB n=1 Tax=Glaciecola siphonariae TaxID=521012 RepID=A0ABV9LSY6_9ALTE
MRGESRISANTRLEIVTEGVLTRMLQSNPELPGVALVIFDEFHERNIHADFALALCIESQQALREDLKLLVMSATLDGLDFNKLLPNAPVLHSQGKAFDVDVVYRPLKSLQNHSTALAAQVSAVLMEVFAQHTQDILIFLPSVFDIHKTMDMIQAKLQENAAVYPLYANLSKEQQLSALYPNTEGKRKVILATNIAETSLTIDGIEVVIDSGLEKVSVFDLSRGVTQLTTQRISQASATQRAGRAGRLMPGTCYRLWAKEQHERLWAHSVPQILQSDIAQFMLEAAVWGSDIKQLVLLDYPSDAQVQQAHEKLQRQGLIDTHGKPTRLGREVHGLSGDIDLALMLIRSKALSAAHLSMACAAAALLETKDVLATSSSPELSMRMSFIQNAPQHPVWRQVKQWHQKLGVAQSSWPIHDLGLVLAFGFTQWIAQNKGDGRLLLANGKGAMLNQEAAQALASHPWCVVCHMQLTDVQSGSAMVRLCEPLGKADLNEHFAHVYTTRNELFWDEAKQRFSAAQNHYFASIKTKSVPMGVPEDDLLLPAWLGLLQDKINKFGASALALDERSEQLLLRLVLLSGFDSSTKDNAANDSDDLDDVQDKAQMLSEQCADWLIQSIEQWLIPALSGKTTWQQLTKLGFYQLMSQHLDYHQSKRLNEQLPEGLSIPTGRKASLRYENSGKVYLSVRMQELYGMREHPTLLGGKLPITIELLSPASRPLQTTQDISRFWSGSYRDIQKEMKGRYPRHFWPDDPAHAKATAATKKKM